MMQQLASVKSESAASALPLNIADTHESKQAFNNILSQESGRMTAFESAQKNAKSSAQQGHTHQSEHNDRITLKQKSDRDNTAQRSEKVAEQKPTDQTTNVDKPKHASNDAAKPSEVEKPGSAEVANTDEVKTAKTKDDLESTVLVNDEVAQDKQSEFDFIAYVTQVAQFSTTETVETEANALIDMQNVDTPEALSLQIPINAENPNQEEVSEFLNISISKDELQAILDAQNAQLDLNHELSAEQLSKLQDIIASMLNQLEPPKNDSSSNNSTLNNSTLNNANKIKQADQALLASLLLNKQSATETASNNQQDSTTKLEALSSQILNGSTQSNASKTAQNATENKITQALEEPSNHIQGLKDELKVELKTQVSIPEVGLKLSNGDIWSKTPDTSVKLPNETVKTAIDNVAVLDEKQSTEALNNLSERVQAIVSDLKTPAKGNEFVAALQAGVKEFKQQLASGREPGIDLKDIVNEAIASTNIEVSPEKQLKIDTTINQFNAVLNLANAVNYSATQQQAQVLGLTDNQFAKEMNVLQTEGTKLANAANSQLNAQANGDKAINIFKSEGQQQLAEKVRWMVNSRNPSAEIRLDPPDLGGMQIKVNLSGDTAQVNFSVQSNAAKDALDQAVPRLRDMLAQQGIELGESNVQQDNQQQQNGQHDEEGSNGQAASAALASVSDSGETLNEPVIEQRISNGSIGGIDHYA